MLLIVMIPRLFGELKIRLSMPPRRQPRAEVPTRARSRERSIERERPCARPSEPATSPLGARAALKTTRRKTRGVLVLTWLWTRAWEKSSARVPGAPRPRARRLVVAPQTGPADGSSPKTAHHRKNDIALRSLARLPPSSLIRAPQPPPSPWSHPLKRAHGRRELVERERRPHARRREPQRGEFAQERPQLDHFVEHPDGLNPMIDLFSPGRFVGSTNARRAYFHPSFTHPHTLYHARSPAGVRSAAPYTTYRPPGRDYPTRP